MYVSPCTARRIAALLGSVTVPRHLGPREPPLDIRVHQGEGSRTSIPSEAPDKPPKVKRLRTAPPLSSLGSGSEPPLIQRLGPMPPLPGSPLVDDIQRWKEAVSCCQQMRVQTGAGQCYSFDFFVDAPLSSPPLPPLIIPEPTHPEQPLPIQDLIRHSQWEPRQQTQGAEMLPSVLPQQQQEGPAKVVRDAEVSWRFPLGRCVDAAPLLVQLLAPLSPAGGQSGGGSVHAVQAMAESGGQGSEQNLGVTAEAALACSHDGSVACLDLSSGRAQWQAQLPGRAEAGMCIACSANNVDAFVAVACGDDRVHFLSLSDGCHCGASPPLDGGLRSPPAVEPIGRGSLGHSGRIWLTTHGKGEVLALQVPSGRIIARWASKDNVSSYQPFMFSMAVSSTGCPCPRPPPAHPSSASCISLLEKHLNTNQERMNNCLPQWIAGRLLLL